jgi:hypothetical protein
MPTRRQICDLAERRIEPEDRGEADYGTILDPRVLKSEELPTMVAAVVRHMQNRRRPEDNLPEGDGHTVWGLVERPIVHRLRPDRRTWSHRVARNTTFVTTESARIIASAAIMLLRLLT